MIVYKPFWETMEKKGFTTYTLREKYKVSPETVQRMRNNVSITMHTLNEFCKILDCRVEDIILYIPDENNSI